MARRTTPRTTTPATVDTTPDVSVDVATPTDVVIADPADVVATTADVVPFADGYRLAVVTATRTVGDAVEPRFTPDIVAALTTAPMVAIAAGMHAVRDVVRTPADIDAAVVRFDAAAAEHHVPTSATTVNVGRYTGRKIMDGQNVMYAVAAIVGAPDAAIAVAWRAEWPGARCNFAVRNDHVTTTRPVVNRGAHGWTNGHGGSVDVVRAWGGPFRCHDVKPNA